MKPGSLAALLAVRRRDEERARRRAGEALARARVARADAERAAAALQHRRGVGRGTVALLLETSRFDARLRLEARCAAASAASADQEREVARGEHAASRAARELVERARARWEVERRRALERAGERELDDLAGPARGWAGSR